MMLDKALAALETRHGEIGASEVILRVHPRVESQLRGMGNENIQILKERFGLKELIVRMDSFVPEDSVLISEVG